jgi:hypothetical protein
MERQPTGDYCNRCRKHVYDLSAMSADAAVALLELQANSDICVSYRTDMEGYLLHAPPALAKPPCGRTSIIGATALLAACNSAPGASREATSSSAAVEASSRQVLADPTPTPQKVAEEEQSLEGETLENCDEDDDAAFTHDSAGAGADIPQTDPTQRRVWGGIRRKPGKPGCDPPYLVNPATGIKTPKPKCL